MYENRKFIFNRNLIVRVIKEEGGWVLESDIPELVGFDTDYNGAEFAFRQDFAVCWDRIACADDSKLHTRGARNPKRALLALVKMSTRKTHDS